MRRKGWQIADVCPPDDDGVFIVTDTRGNVFAAEYRERGFEGGGRLAPGTPFVWRDLETFEHFFSGDVVAWQEFPDPFDG